MKFFKELRIVFIGTPEFAVASLSAIIEAGGIVVAVITVPDKPAGRGMKIHTSAVKDFADAKNIPVLQPVKLKSPDFLEQLKAYKADLQVVVAFRMLPEVVWNMPPMGTINVHASLLPQYRGAAPINWAIINGETETGVTTFKLKHEIDTGDILLQQKLPILPTDNAGTLHDKLMDAGAQLLVTTIHGLAEGNLKEIPQKEVADTQIKHAPKIFRQHLQIDWNQPVSKIHNLINGLSPYPAAHTLLGDKNIKIFSSHYLVEAHEIEYGIHQIITHHKGRAFDELRIAAKDGWLYIDELQQEGKKRLLTADFLRGYRM